MSNQPLADMQVLDADILWEYTVLVTDVAYPLESIGQLYRDRCDCENGFDELKNQWSLSGFTTQDNQPLPDDSQGWGADLQPVELVLPCGSSEC